MPTDKKAFIDTIIQEEWRQFQLVANKGGRADCQESPDTFYAMRAAQFDTWPGRLLDSYCRDLFAAKERGDNLLFQKYAYMMESTAPEEFEKIRDYLPTVSEERRRIIGEIADIHMRWTEEFDKAYPNLAGRSRPETLDVGSLGITSFRTYLEGELTTYGNETLSLYYLFTKKCEEHKVNLTYRIRENMAVNAGYASVEEAEDRLGGNV